MPPRLALDLARTHVFLDFDGTISTVDVGTHLLERFADPAWRAVDDAFVAGELSSRECLIDEWALVADPSEAEMRAVARAVPLDPGFEPLVRGLLDAGAEVTVVSDGFGFYVAEACAPTGVEVLANDVDWSTGRLEFPHEDRCCACATCGVCKQAPIREARHRGLTTVLVGDGASDRKAALLADVVIAKAALAGWCARAGVPHVRFERLADVHALLLGPPA